MMLGGLVMIGLLFDRALQTVDKLVLEEEENDEDRQDRYQCAGGETGPIKRKLTLKGEHAHRQRT